MANLFSLLGRYRGAGGQEIDQAVSSTKDSSLQVAQGAGLMEEVTRRGQLWSTQTTSAVAALVVRPSTVAALEVWNGYPAGGPSLVVDRLMAFNLVATAVNSNGVLWAMVTPPKAIPALTALNINNHRGGVSLMITSLSTPVVTGAGTTVIDNGWFPWGPNYIASNAAAPGGGWSVDVNGRLIVPPGCSLCVQVTGSIVGDTYTEGASWYLKQLDLP